MVSGEITLCHIRFTQTFMYLQVLLYPHVSSDGWESASLSDDDEDGEWIDVHHSSDEEQKEVVSDENNNNTDRRKWLSYNFQECSGYFFCFSSDFYESFSM